MRRGTGTRPTQEAVTDVITRTVMDRLSEGNVASVGVEFDEDAEGDEIINVRIIISGSPASLDAKSMSGLITALRIELNDLEEDGFPIVRFISKNDFQRRRA